MFNTKTKQILLCTLLMAFLPGMALAQNFTPHSLLSEGQWFKIPISNTGVYKITIDNLPALNNTPCNQIALYSTPGEMLSTSTRDLVNDDLMPVAAEIADNNNNGIFDQGDYILFYAESPNVWRYIPADNRFEYIVHPYANLNYYYLTTTAQSSSLLRIQPSLSGTFSPLPVTTHTGVALFHEDNINTHGGGQIWVADKFSPGYSSRSYTLNLENIPATPSLLARYSFANVSDLASGLKVQLAADTRQHTLSNSTYQILKETFSSPNSKSITLTLTYQPRENSAAGYLDFIELNATLPLTYTSGQQIFRNQQLSDTTSHLLFLANGNADGLRLWDITSPLQPSTLDITPSANSFSFTALADHPRTFIAFTLSDAYTPSSIQPIPNQDLHGSQPPDLVIVAHQDYLSQANRLASLHNLHDGLTTLVVSQEQVFNEFSSGKPDPVAIRQLLRCLRAKATPDNPDAPRYLLLFGKGTYDNRDILGAHQTTVVTYQTPTSFDSEGQAYPSDDLYGYLSDYASSPFDGTLSVSIGRLPAKSQAEADLFVNKIDNYINHSDFLHNDIRGDWRNYVTLLADDADPSSPHDSVFASDSEILARKIKKLYPQYNIDRIYADAYFQQSGADGSYYPDVNNALNRRINYGTLLLNYIGHGSSTYIGTERYMEFSDIDKYTNTDRLTFFVTSTCTFGKFDQVNDICGSEAFLLAKAAGIGVIAASRPIHHSQRFNTDLCIQALNPANTIGDALRIAKNSNPVSHCIALIGDPALRLSIPRNQIQVTHINQMPVNPAVTDSATVLSRVTVQGQILDPQGNPLPDFNGTIYPIVFDREVKCRTLANDNDSTQVNFIQQKNILYKGREPVISGQFSYSFIIPRDVSYHYDYAKLSHYARSSSDDASGQYSNIMFGGFNDDITITELHPHIQLYIGDTNFRNGGLTNENPILYARLSDSIGINAAGSGLGHDITAIIDNNPYSTINLNDLFEPDINDSRNGELRYTLGKLDQGPHTLTLKCWNIFNYSSSATIQFTVANDRTPSLGQFTASPNPASSSTLLRIEHNLTTTIHSATIYIYDTRGSLVRTITPTIGPCTLSFLWNFTASNGSLLPKGIYAARALITTDNGTQLSQTAKIVRN